MPDERPCEVCPGFGPSDRTRATHRATYDKDLFPVTGKFRFDLCPQHAQKAKHNGATLTKIGD